MRNGAEAVLPSLSVTVALREKIPFFSGAPVMRPLPDMEMPLGSPDREYA